MVSDENLCVYLPGVDDTSISCSSGVYKKCISGRLVPDLNFKCKHCRGEVQPINSCPLTGVLEWSLRWLSPSATWLVLCPQVEDVLLATITHCQVTWKKFYHL